ncbi:hypothetical protein RCF13_04585, partial [Stenotrophomonas maltophilia group sp. RNC7]|nr:hypothetical protein [Stenotrophomonas maltophilia group sp. RNC7]
LGCCWVNFYWFWWGGGWGIFWFMDSGGRLGWCIWFFWGGVVLYILNLGGVGGGNQGGGGFVFGYIYDAGLGFFLGAFFLILWGGWAVKAGLEMARKEFRPPNSVTRG